jgi:hypothetical protein
MIRAAFIALILLSQASTAQNFLSWKFKDRYFSTTLGTGTSTYFGELNYKNQISERLTQLNAGIEARLLNRISARIEATYFKITGDDNQAPDSSFQRQRNLHFQSRNFHIQLNTIYYLKDYQGDYHRRLIIDPYLFSGVGYLFYNPRAKLGNELFSLRDAQTEGIKYDKWTVTIPVGVGTKFKINEFANLNFEVSYHFTFTDYLDDVSTTYASEFSNETSQLLSIRKDEVGVVDPTFYDQIQPGSPRGDASDNDRFLQISLKLELFIPPELFSGKREPVIKKPSY